MPELDAFCWAGLAPDILNFAACFRLSVDLMGSSVSYDSLVDGTLHQDSS